MSAFAHSASHRSSKAGVLLALAALCAILVPFGISISPAKMALDALWAESFPARPRPQVYSSQEIGKDGYLPLTETSKFLVDSLHGLSASQLYALAANNAEVLRQAQEEWISLEALAAQVKSQDRFSASYKDPQVLPAHDVFEERKEAILYNYKYEANRPMVQSKFTLPTGTTDQEKFDLREPPNPFAQRIPNDKQYRSIMSTARNEGREKNPDNQTPYEQNFAFQLRPKGFWVAKMAPNESVQPPRTRAREAQLNGTAFADRQTRFNGEKIPRTKGVASADEPLSRSDTPIGSPASRKRKIETVDVALPRKRHPNQYSKRKEREDAEHLGSIHLHRGASDMTQQTDATASQAPTPKKKHPNQYTKRREREEAERLAREQATLHYNGGHGQPIYDHLRPSASVPARSVTPEKKKQPNQYTRRRERDQTEDESLPENRSGWVMQRSYRTRDNELLNGAGNATRPATPLSPKPQPHVHPGRNIDFSRLTTAELRTFTFKDRELVDLLQERYLWLNDDPALAEQWKIKIENSAYAMRTYAMLKKWKEWASEGRDKRPRDKDKNKSKAAGGNGNTSKRGFGEEADVESMADDAPKNSTNANFDHLATRRNSKIVTLRRIPRTRASRLPAEPGESAKAMPSSPLANGVNARDLDDQAKVRSFTSTLKTIEQYDNATKIGRWQAESATEPTVGSRRGTGTEDHNASLPKTMSLLRKDTGDDQQGSQQSGTTPARDKMDVDSEDPLALPNHSQSSGSMLLFRSSQEDVTDTIRAASAVRRQSNSPVPRGRETRPRRSGRVPMPTPRESSSMTRTRSQRSTRSTTATTTTTTTVSPAKALPPPTMPTASNKPRVTRGTSTTSSSIRVVTAYDTPTFPATNNHEDDDDGDGDSDDDDDEYNDEDNDNIAGVAALGAGGAGISTRRAGLRPNPIKRTLTDESLKTGSRAGRDLEAPIGVRRSLRNSGVV